MLRKMHDLIVGAHTMQRAGFSWRATNEREEKGRENERREKRLGAGPFGHEMLENLRELLRL